MRSRPSARPHRHRWTRSVMERAWTAHHVAVCRCGEVREWSQPLEPLR